MFEAILAEYHTVHPVTPFILEKPSHHEKRLAIRGSVSQFLLSEILLLAQALHMWRNKSREKK